MIGHDRFALDRVDDTDDQQQHAGEDDPPVPLLVLVLVAVPAGIAAIGKAHFYVGNAHYEFGDLKTWGWVVLIIGVIQVLVGLGVFARNQLARWTGVAALGLNSLAQLLMMPAYPVTGSTSDMKHAAASNAPAVAFTTFSGRFASTSGSSTAETTSAGFSSPKAVETSTGH